MNTVDIQYSFTLPSGSQEVFHFKLDKKGDVLLENIPETLPRWTLLDFCKCPNCPLNPNTNLHCPLAVSLVNVVTRFNGLDSYETIRVEVNTNERNVLQYMSAQKGISSLMGLVIATSRCPHAKFFKPMAHFHVPFESIDEIIFRAVSTYLLFQYFFKKEGNVADIELEGLKKICQNIRVVNSAVVSRLQGACDGDSTINAMVILDVFAVLLPIAINGSMEKYCDLFMPFIHEKKLLND